MGDLGRIVIQEMPDGRTHLACEVAGDPLDPRTAERAAIFGPLAREVTRQMEVLTGPGAEIQPTSGH